MRTFNVNFSHDMPMHSPKTAWFIDAYNKLCHRVSPHQIQSILSSLTLHKYTINSYNLKSIHRIQHHAVEWHPLRKNKNCDAIDSNGIIRIKFKIIYCRCYASMQNMCQVITSNSRSLVVSFQWCHWIWISSNWEMMLKWKWKQIQIIQPSINSVHLQF